MSASTPPPINPPGEHVPGEMVLGRVTIERYADSEGRDGLKVFWSNPMTGDSLGEIEARGMLVVADSVIAQAYMVCNCENCAEEEEEEG